MNSQHCVSASVITSHTERSKRRFLLRPEVLRLQAIPLRAIESRLPRQWHEWRGRAIAANAIFAKLFIDVVNARQPCECQSSTGCYRQWSEAELTVCILADANLPNVFDTFVDCEVNIIRNISFRLELV